MIDIQQALSLLGGISPQKFMTEYWQRKPLLIRQAIPCSSPLVSLSELKGFAKDGDIESRLILRQPDGWELQHGPFKRLPSNDHHLPWSLLIQGVNLLSDKAADLMNQFRFIPDARIDDVMISLANDQGGVGPHFDSYDVFLLQGHGKRCWKIGRQHDLTLIEGMPVKILKHFEPEHEFILEAGDMLYLPPHYAHDGIALGNECMTISIGFRSASETELVTGVFEYLAETLNESTDHEAPHYQDPEQVAVAHPAKIPDLLVNASLKAVQKVVIDAPLVSRFLGSYLTEPKPHIFFEQADIDWDELPKTGYFYLDRRTQMMYDEQHLYINGEVHLRHSVLIKFADEKRLSAESKDLDDESISELLLEWLDAGWIHHTSS